MCRKLFLTAVAVIIGLVVVKHTRVGSWMRVQWNDWKVAATKAIPPETKIKELELKVGDIDKEIRRHLPDLARIEVACQDQEKEVKALVARRDEFKDEVKAMRNALETKTERVSFGGSEYRTSELTARLDSRVQELNQCKATLKAKEQLLTEQKRVADETSRRLDAMRQAKKRMDLAVAQLKAQLANLRAKQTEARVDLDDSQVGRCNELLTEIEKDLREAEKELELQVKFGYKAPSAAIEGEQKSKEEVLKAAKKALAEEAEPVAADK